jgi:hypothetical protein
MYEETFSTDGECDRAEHASRRSIRRRFEHTVDTETHRRRKTGDVLNKLWMPDGSAGIQERYGEMFSTYCACRHTCECKTPNACYCNQNQNPQKQ